MRSHLKRHVLYVSPVGDLGGAEQVILAYARLLAEKGYQTSLAILRPGNLEEYAKKQGITVHLFPHDYRYRDLITVCKSIHWLNRIIVDNHVDIIHVNYSGHLQSYFAINGTSAKEVWHIHDYPYAKTINEVVNKIFKPDMIIYTSNKNKSGYNEMSGIKNAVIYPCCVDVGLIRDGKIANGIRDRFDLRDRRFFITVTRLQAHKGHRYLIEAAHQVAKTHPDVLWLIVGKASGREQEAYLESLKAQVREAKLESVFRFLGFVSDSDLAALRREAYSLVHPAVSEGYGLVLIESMAAGIPVIAAAADGPVEILQGQNNGLLVPELHASLVAGGNLYVESHSVQRMCEETMIVYDWLFD